MAWSESEHDDVVKALAVVCEVTGAHFSNPARQFLVRELENYDCGEVLVALRRCAREVTRQLALAHIIERIEEEREKGNARRRAADSIEETRLRSEALAARIPWELGKEKVKELLAQVAKGLPAHDPAKEAARARSLAQQKHWSETEPDE